MAKKISITLTACNMGDVTEADFDAWHRYVCDHIDEALGFEVHEVDQHPFANGPAKNTISGATDEQEEAIREWLSHGGYEAFCATPEAWPKAG